MHEMTVAEAHAAFLEHRKRRRRAASTLDLYSRQLANWREWRAKRYDPLVKDVSLKELQGFFIYLEDDIKAQPRTIHSFFRTLRALWNWLSFEEAESGDPVLSAKQLNYFKNDRIPLPDADERERPALAKDDYERLLLAVAANNDSEERYRNEAILRLLWESGARIHEIAKLDNSNIDIKQSMAILVGKGGKEGAVFWGPMAHSAIVRYLQVRRGPMAGPLLRGVSSRNNGRALTANLIRMLIKRLAKQAGVKLPPGSPCHSFRRAFARNARKADLSYADVGGLLRDSSGDVVRTYIGIDREPLQKLHGRALKAM